MRGFVGVLSWILSVVLSAVAGFAQGAALPDPVLAQLRADPKRFVTEAAEVIAGHGGASGISQAGLDLVVALEAAEVRADVVRRLLAADVDADGSISGAEVEARAAALGARARGQVRLAFRGADANGDGVADWAELRDHARRRADVVAGTRPAMLRALIAFDRDGDGFVTVEELAAGAAEVLAAPKVAAQAL